MLPNTLASRAASSKVAALLSIGQHPLTGRARRADQDARALEMALNLADIELLPVHAGWVDEASEAALRGYIGMGVPELHLLEQPVEADVVPALEVFVRQQQVSLVLCGGRAEAGEGSGLLPYQLAQRLGWPVISGLAEIEHLRSDSVTLLQALPRGQRRRLKVSLPAVLALDSAAPAARQSAFGPARRGQLMQQSADVKADLDRNDWQFQPARKRPKRLKIIKATSARDRFKAAAAKAEASGGEVLQNLSADKSADAILKMLLEEGVLNRDKSA
ncbi:electron transfer flavoprotein subunit beta [Nitrincola sp. A-D6]|uniref:electron transfer flavoprotein subunit beta n=1 Tax=Nitrincola sp. A-D6 TaxID=1545442 RepID=UPI00051F9BF9|nr:electron transfer flavoprotein subunit beta [Nitrincola sp. A-D6]KGK41963.1 electron transfer flavoprotein subunit beta [Nitrincola sp. A-D6]